jgi:hypothetical protein
MSGPGGFATSPQTLSELQLLVWRTTRIRLVLSANRIAYHRLRRRALKMLGHSELEARPSYDYELSTQTPDGSR